MGTDVTDPLEALAWAAELSGHLGRAGPLTAVALAERLQANHPGLTVEQVKRELRARADVHESAAG